MIDSSAYGARYLRVADDLRAQIADGRLAPGDQLPAEKALEYEYDTGRDTVRAALRVLAADGAVELRGGYRARVREREPRTVSVPRGSRMVVRHPTPEEQLATGLHASAFVVEVSTGQQHPRIYDATVTTFTTS